MAQVSLLVFYIERSVYIASYSVFVAVGNASFAGSGAVHRNLAVFLLSVDQWILFFGAATKDNIYFYLFFLTAGWCALRNNENLHLKKKEGKFGIGNLYIEYCNLSLAS